MLNIMVNEGCLVVDDDLGVHQTISLPHQSQISF